MGFATVTVPLTGWWGGSHAIKKEKLQVKNTENQLADQRELLVIRMKNAWNGVNEAYEQMKIARLSIEQSTENLRLNTDYYKAGTCTICLMHRLCISRVVTSMWKAIRIMN